MLYKFKSRDSGDVIMMQASAQRVLEAIGKPADPQGIIEPGQLPAAIAALHRAIDEDEAARARAREEAGDDHRKVSGDAISLKTRAWPLIEMMERAAKHEQPVIWGA